MTLLVVFNKQFLNMLCSRNIIAINTIAKSNVSYEVMLLAGSSLLSIHALLHVLGARRCPMPKSSSFTRTWDRYRATVDPDPGPLYGW